MMYSVDVLRTVGRGSGASVVGMVCPPLSSAGTGSACVRCCHFRKKQRLLAALSASTGLSLLLFVLHTSPSFLSTKDPQDTSKELPEKSHYVKDVIESHHDRQEVRETQVLRAATYISDTRSQRLPHKISDKNNENLARVEVNDGERAAGVEPELQVLPMEWKHPLGQHWRRVGDDGTFEVGTRRGIDSPTGVNSANTSENTAQGSSPSLAGPHGLVAPAEAERQHRPLLLMLDYSRPSYYPWRTTKDECTNFATRFLVDGGAPVMALVSFPGSGNTWLRYLTETITGVFTGSVYHEETLAKRGFLGERDGHRKGTTLMQKTHSYPLLPEENFNGTEFKLLLPRSPRKVVLLIRSPWEAVVALRHYHAAGHTGFGSNTFFRGPGWANFTVHKSKVWVRLNKVWLTLPKTTIHVIHYEHLQHQLEEEMLRLMRFLGLPLDYGRLECLLRYPEGRFRRPKYPKQLQGYRFPVKVDKILQEGMAVLNAILARGGHPTLPTHLYNFKPIFYGSGDSPAPLVAVPVEG
ncbi:uncharacterized protein LOC121865175 [Homarus americanus]|uniref:uncharacterized protein LOC121865175 n=1 Tax=Homarus americanus TaxID=6706 RepID=UPI001C45B002|nr:uncharacterized protein LOC121865175 [Homarus americanus]